MLKVRADITSDFGGGKYRTVATVDVEDFMVDSAMDTDTDSWAISIGDPKQALIGTLNPDSEIRLNIFASGRGRVSALNTGFVDDAVYTQSGTLQFTGRDITAVAADSQHPPGSFRLVRPEVFVAKDARELKIGDRLQLTAAPMFKQFHVDSSETYWEAWYRLYRKRRMWLWAEPDGTLIASELNYSSPPVYFFGGNTGARGKNTSGWIPVERAEIRSNKQQRLWEVYIVGSRGDIPIIQFARDSSISRWIKRRKLFLTSSTAHDPAEARFEAMEEIYEGKVGALEIKLTIADPGFIVRQNRIARVNIPKIGLKGDFYVVGARQFGSSQAGLYQEVRLRQRDYAISRRVPSLPSAAITGTSTPSDKQQFGASGIGSNLSTQGGGDVRWAYHFVEAANKHHGPWPYQLFLATLMSICEQETGFRNVRGGGHTEWPGTASGSPPDRVDRAEFAKFASTFANEPKYGRTNSTYAVGPMQLYDANFKEAADTLGGTAHDELTGARWEPRWNIIEAAAALRGKLQASGAEAALTGDSDPYELIWAGVAGYGHHYDGEPAFSVTNRYAREVRKRYDETYKAKVASAVSEASPQKQTGNQLVKELAADSRVTQKMLDVVQFALDQVGKPYVWGKENPSEGFDCSGLIDYAYRKIGVDLPGRLTTTSALTLGRSVLTQGINGWLPGDWMITNYGKHMVMYIGQGNVVAASSVDQKVEVQPAGWYVNGTGAMKIVDVRRWLVNG